MMTLGTCRHALGGWALDDSGKCKMSARALGRGGAVGPIHGSIAASPGLSSSSEEFVLIVGSRCVR